MCSAPRTCPNLFGYASWSMFLSAVRTELCAGCAQPGELYTVCWLCTARWAVHCGWLYTARWAVHCGWLSTARWAVHCGWLYKARWAVHCGWLYTARWAVHCGWLYTARWAVHCGCLATAWQLLQLADCPCQLGHTGTLCCRSVMAASSLYSLADLPHSLIGAIWKVPDFVPRVHFCAHTSFISYPPVFHQGFYASLRIPTAEHVMQIYRVRQKNVYTL